MSAYTSPLLSAFGVFEATGPDAGVAAHYGEPLKEQRRLVLGAEKFVLADYSHLGVVTVSGPDRLSWLTTISSQVLAGLSAGESTELLLLSVQGRIDFAAYAVDDGEKVWLICEGSQAADLAEYLDSMKFMLRVEIADVSDTYAVLSSTADPRTAETAPEKLAAGVIWEDPWPGITAGGHSYAEVSEQEHPGADFKRFFTIVDRSDLMEIASSVSLAGVWAAEALRIEAWRPRFGTEVDEKTIPHELDLMRTAVHMNKGCYKGQETIARVHNLGHPPRRLVFLDLDGSEHTLPAAGSAVYAGSKKVGRVTSVAQHWEAGSIALAVIKRTVDPAAELRVVDETTNADTPAQYAAAQTVIVSPEAGQTVGRRDMGDFLRR